MRILFTGLFLAMACLLQASDYNLVIKELNEVLGQRDTLFHRYEQRMEQYRSQLVLEKDPHKRFELSDHLFDFYKSYKSDSAYVYARKTDALALLIDEPDAKLKAHSNLIFCFSSTGLFKEASDLISHISFKGVSEEAKINYYQVVLRYYGELCNFHNDKHYSTIYKAQQQLYMDSLLVLINPASIEYADMRSSQRAQNRENRQEQIRILSKFYHEKGLTQHQMAIYASVIGRLYAEEGNLDQAIRYTAYSAIYDTYASARETTSLKNLAEYLFQKGEVEQASRYIDLALQDANFYNARHRKMEINSILPRIEREMFSNSESQRTKVTLLFLVALFFMLISLYFLYMHYRKSVKLKDAQTVIEQHVVELSTLNEALAESNRIKDHYIVHSLYGKIEYIDKVESMLKLINRQIISKRYDELQRVYRHFDVKQERDGVYEDFDKIFLMLMPNFIERYNQLLAPEHQVILDQSKKLPSEVRIFALMRLGIRDAERIASLLNFSVNTVYTYKTKVKNRTIVPKDDFERLIMEID